MNIQEFHFLLEKYDSGEIRNEELQRLDHLITTDPVIKKEFENRRLVEFGVKSYALRKELEEVMACEDNKQKRYNHWLWTFGLLIVLVLIAIVFWPTRKTSDQLYETYYELYPNFLVTRNAETNSLMDGYVAYNQGRFRDAVQLIERSPQYTEDHDLAATFFLGQAYMATGNFENSLESFITISEGTYFYWDSQWYAALIYLKTDPEKARLILENIVEQESDYNKKEARKILRHLD